MKYRELGTTGIRVSEIGFGAWGIGGDSYGSTNDHESAEVLLRAVDEGVNFYDMSDLYGRGHSETLIGKTLKDHRERIILATKGGILSAIRNQVQQDFSSSYITKALELSLKRLRTDYVDLYQLHNPDPQDLTDELLATITRLKEDGVIRALGVSLRSPVDGPAILAKYRFDSIQVNFNMIDQRALEDGLMEHVRSVGIGFIARTPLNFGFLTGTLSDLTFGENDHRSSWSKEQLELWSKAPALFDSIYKDGGKSKAQLALQFCLAFDSVSTVIPGMVKIAEVEENCRTSYLSPLTRGEIELIRLIYRSNTFMSSKSKNKVIRARYNS